MWNRFSQRWWKILRNDLILAEPQHSFVEEELGLGLRNKRFSVRLAADH